MHSTSAQEPAPVSPSANAAARRVRAQGGGRKRLTEKDATLLGDLDALVEPTARGDPQSPLRWTCKSTPRLARELSEQGHRVSQRSVCDLLAQLNYSLQSTRKTREGGLHPDRDALFRHINAMAAQYQAAGDPVISVDTKKKELVGDFKNGGQEWRPIRFQLDENSYQAVIKVSDEELAELAIEREQFHGEWNYRFCPRVDQFDA